MAEFIDSGCRGGGTMTATRAREALYQHLETCDQCLQYPPLSCWAAMALLENLKEVSRA